MDERQDVQPKDKNIAQLLVKLATAQAQIKLVLAAQYMNKQRVTINTKMKEFKEYAEGQAEKYSQNAEEATEVIENYKKAVEEAMQKFGDDYLDTMAKQDEYQKMEVESIGIEKQYALELKEKRKKPEYQEWKQEVKALNREIKANANNPEKLASLAAELKDLQAKDPTYWEKQRLDFAKRDRASINEMIQFYDKELEICRAIATGADLLLLDEPAAGLNPSETIQLMDIIKNIKTKLNKSIFLIEHDMKLVMGISDRIVVLDYGEKIAEGSPEEIRNNPAVIKAYLGKGE